MASQYVWRAGNAVFGPGTPGAAAWAQPLCQALEERGAPVVLEAMAQLAPSAIDAVREVELGKEYFGGNATRMRYPAFAAAGLPIGSGMVEGACKQRRWRPCGPSTARGNGQRPGRANHTCAAQRPATW